MFFILQRFSSRLSNFWTAPPLHTRRLPSFLLSTCIEGMVPSWFPMPDATVLIPTSFLSHLFHPVIPVFIAHLWLLPIHAVKTKSVKVFPGYLLCDFDNLIIRFPCRLMAVPAWFRFWFERKFFKFLQNVVDWASPSKRITERKDFETNEFAQVAFQIVLWTCTVGECKAIDDLVQGSFKDRGETAFRMIELL